MVEQYILLISQPSYIRKLYAIRLLGFLIDPSAELVLREKKAVSKSSRSEAVNNTPG